MCEDFLDHQYEIFSGCASRLTGLTGQEIARARSMLSLRERRLAYASIPMMAVFVTPYYRKYVEYILITFPTAKSLLFMLKPINFAFCVGPVRIKYCP